MVSLSAGIEYVLPSQNERLDLWPDENAFCKKKVMAVLADSRIVGYGTEYRTAGRKARRSFELEIVQRYTYKLKSSWMTVTVCAVHTF
jgi:hypothetical protein